KQRLAGLDRLLKLFNFQRISRKGEDVGRRVFAPVVAVQLADGGIICEQQTDLDRWQFFAARSFERKLSGNGIKRQAGDFFRPDVEIGVNIEPRRIFNTDRQIKRE